MKVKADSRRSGQMRLLALAALSGLLALSVYGCGASGREAAIKDGRGMAGHMASGQMGMTGAKAATPTATPAVTKAATPKAAATAVMTASPAAKASAAPAAAAAPAAGGDQFAAAKALFRAKGCVGCHVVAGVPGAVGNVGPSLNGIASRSQLAAGLTVSPENLKKWIGNPAAVKAGTLMPDLGLSDAEIETLVVWLMTLK